MITMKTRMTVYTSLLNRKERRVNAKTRSSETRDLFEACPYRRKNLKPHALGTAGFPPASIGHTSSQDQLPAVTPAPLVTTGDGFRTVRR
jgi:hypothetical protein